MKHKNLKIFLIEDDVLYRSKMNNWLGRITDNVKMFETAEDAIDPISDEKPDIILLDNFLPNMKGREVVELYKLCSAKSTIIMISSRYTIDEIAKSIQSKADFLLNKNGLTEVKLNEIIDSSIEQKHIENGLWSKITSFTNIFKSLTNNDIVIIDDDELFSSKLEKKILDFKRSYQVKYFPKVDDFYLYAENTSPKYIFLDYFFPDTTGYDVLLLIKSILPNTKVIIISSQDNAEVALKLKSLGIDNYIMKDDNWSDNLVKVLQKFEEN